jgi:hypothetical protein
VYDDVADIIETEECQERDGSGSELHTDRTPVVGKFSSHQIITANRM